MTDLTELAERCEQATGPDRELDALIAMSVGCRGYSAEHISESAATTAEWARGPDDLKSVAGAFAVPTLTASLDAAMTLVPEGWSFTIRSKSTELEHPAYDKAISFAATPALALCAAALRARHTLAA